MSKKQLPLSILIVDDEEGIRHGLKSWFSKRYQVYDSPDYETAISIANKKNPDIAVLDIRLKGNKTGIDLFRELMGINADMIVILITGYGSLSDAVAAMKEGAKDYLLKPIDNHKLSGTIEKCLEINSLRNENAQLRDQLKKKDPPFHFIGDDPVMKIIKDKADKIKNNPVPVLITGESGTGKEVLARYLHYTSNRQKKNFVAINCAAIVDTLLLSELFGHEKGSFTGATTSKIGKFELADGGHLFMDEIGDMSLSNQAALLRVLETQSFERVGGNQTIKVDVRLITATNKDMTKAVASKKFREDLFYRLNVIPFELPALRNRKADIPKLANHFLKLCNQKYHKHIQEISPDAMDLLYDYHWPGNIRELNNVVNQMILLTNSDIIHPQDVEYRPLTNAKPGFREPDYNNVASVRHAINEISILYEKRMIEEFLKQANNNQSEAARNLGMTRKTLAKKIQKYHIIINLKKENEPTIFYQ